jgi:protein-tyrosine-phosphatase
LKRKKTKESKLVVFVCTGNICRSIMAEALLRHLWSDKGTHSLDLDVSSAGLHACTGSRATDKVLFLLGEEGIDVSSHRARQLTPEMIAEADLILTMTRAHKAQALYMASEKDASKIKTLKEFVKIADDGDIEDPYGGDLGVYEYSLQEIRASVLKLLAIMENYFETP